VALQEVETWTENQPDRYRSLLQQLTGQTWTVVWAPVVSGGATEGNVLLTRLPVVSTSTYQMHATSNHTELYANRSAAQATVRVNGVNVSVFSTHLDYYNTSHRSTQLEQLMAWAGNFAGPRLVTGDFNSWWGEYWITRMTQSYSDTWAEVTGNTDLGYTVNGAVRFDYIFRSFSGSSRATPVNCTTPSTSLSDHYPVIADFTIQ
jgi:endonuclease/exonuclease/phosphatase family metal-dependent hydrolase